MKRVLFETSFSKIYMIVMILIILLVIGGYFSYAMFTVTKERSNAIRIVTGNLTYKLEVDGKESTTLTVEANTTKEFIITLSNPNNRVARFNFYYEGNLPTNVTAGYEVEDGLNPPPTAVGANLEKADAIGSSNTYKIKITNNSGNNVTISLGVEVGLDYNDLTLPKNGYLFQKYEGYPVSEIVNNIQSTTNDGIDTFIIGEDPNNYIWYSGKLWRAVSINNEAKTTKLVTQWNISAIFYSNGNSTFEGSYIEEWLNDTSVDGFLGNLRDYKNFIVTDAKWDATLDDTTFGSRVERPNGTTVVTDAVGLLNYYEYVTSYIGSNYYNGYLNNGLQWWLLTPYNSSKVWAVNSDGRGFTYSSSTLSYGVRPSINLKSSVKIVSGDGTIDNPYRLNGDNDTDLSGELLNTRYSGEYIRFGNDENNLYRIVSHENEIGTKITTAGSLKNSGTFITSVFGDNTMFSSTNTIGAFLNGDYLTNYIESNYSNMIEDSTTWYLGTVTHGGSYRLAKYTDANMSSLTNSVTSAKVGLLRYGELMSGQFDSHENNTSYWLLTPCTSHYVRLVNAEGGVSNTASFSLTYGINPSFNLKSNVVITGGAGTKQDPFIIELS